MLHLSPSPRRRPRHPAVEPAEAAAVTEATAAAAVEAAAVTEPAAPASAVVPAEVPGAPSLGVADHRHAEPGVLAPLQQPAGHANRLRQLGRHDADARGQAVRRERDRRAIPGGRSTRLLRDLREPSDHGCLVEHHRPRQEVLARGHVRDIRARDDLPPLVRPLAELQSVRVQRDPARQEQAQPERQRRDDDRAPRDRARRVVPGAEGDEPEHDPDHASDRGGPEPPCRPRLAIPLRRVAEPVPRDREEAPVVLHDAIHGDAGATPERERTARKAGRQHREHRVVGGVPRLVSPPHRQRIVPVEDEVHVLGATRLALANGALVPDRDDPAAGEQHDGRRQPACRRAARHEPDREQPGGLGVGDGERRAGLGLPQPLHDERSDADRGGQGRGEREQGQQGRAEATGRGCRERLGAGDDAGAGIRLVDDDLAQHRDDGSFHERRLLPWRPAGQCRRHPLFGRLRHRVMGAERADAAGGEPRTTAATVQPTAAAAAASFAARTCADGGGGDVGTRPMRTASAASTAPAGDEEPPPATSGAARPDHATTGRDRGEQQVMHARWPSR